MTKDNTDTKTVRKEKAIAELTETSQTTREFRESALPHLDAVPVEILEKLAEAWKNPANTSESHHERLECAQQLEEIIEKYN